MVMAYEIPPIEGAIYRGKSGPLRRVVKVHDQKKWFGTSWSYNVEWAPAKDEADYFGNPRKLKAWCATWESWVKERVR
jgi:hypothetical protein